MAFHSELRDASGLPFVLSINNVPEAWELYSRAGSIARLCSGKNSAAGAASGQSSARDRIEWGNPVLTTGLTETSAGAPAAVARTRPAPGPRQARTRPGPRPAPGPRAASSPKTAPGRQGRTSPAPGPRQGAGSRQARTRPAPGFKSEIRLRYGARSQMVSASLAYSRRAQRAG